MAEFSLCLDCPGACCKAPLSNHSNMDNFGEVRRHSMEHDIESVAQRVQEIIEGTKRMMEGAALRLLGVIFDVEEAEPWIIYYSLEYSV